MGELDAEALDLYTVRLPDTISFNTTRLTLQQVQWRSKDLHRAAIRTNRNVLHHCKNIATLRQDREVLAGGDARAEVRDCALAYEWG